MTDYESYLIYSANGYTCIRCKRCHHSEANLDTQFSLAFYIRWAMAHEESCEVLLDFAERRRKMMARLDEQALNPVDTEGEALEIQAAIDAQDKLQRQLSGLSALKDAEQWYADAMASRDPDETKQAIDAVRYARDVVNTASIEDGDGSWTPPAGMAEELIQAMQSGQIALPEVEQ